jgi:hypothetical protein
LRQQNGEVDSFEVSEHHILRVVEDSEVDAITSKYSIKDVEISFFVYNYDKLRGQLLAGITAIVDKFNVAAMLDDF